MGCFALAIRFALLPILINEITSNIMILLDNGAAMNGMSEREYSGL